MLMSAPTIPTVNPSGYGQSILDAIGPQLAVVLPYAAAILAVCIGLGFIKGWIGRTKATNLAADYAADRKASRGTRISYDDYNDL